MGSDIKGFKYVKCSLKNTCINVYVALMVACYYLRSSTCFEIVMGPRYLSFLSRLSINMRWDGGCGYAACIGHRKSP